MGLSAKLLAAGIYLLIWPARVLRVLRGEDRLLLRPQNTSASYWIDRVAQPDTASYFSEESVAEGGNAKRGLARLLVALSRFYAPPVKTSVHARSRHRAERETGIPDETYTLW